MGRKMGHQLRYDERLSLQPYMSDGSFGPSYSLFGVISHAGNGPNSGHYYAHIKDGQGCWYEMNDECVTRISVPPVSQKNAYVLFYLRERGQALESAIFSTREPLKSGLVAGMKKRKLPQETDEDTGVRTSPVASRPTTPAKFIGPLLPSPDISSPIKKQKTSDSQDPQAEALRKKIEAVTEKTKGGEKEGQVKKALVSISALQSLSQYTDNSGDSDDDEDNGDDPSQEEIEKAKEKIPVPLADSTISTSSFYRASSSNATPFKNKSNLSQQLGSPRRNRSEEGTALFRKKSSVISPYDRLTRPNVNNLRRGSITQRYGKKKRLII